MYFFLPFILILVSLAVIIGLLVRKFPELSLLQVEELPEVKEGKKKDEFLKKQVKKKNKEKLEKKRESWKPVIQMWKNWQLTFRKYVGEIERKFFQQRVKKVREEHHASGQSVVQTVQTLLQDAKFALDQKQLDAAEKKYIDAIRLEPKNKDAYRGLGDVYFEQGHLQEAKETYLFLLHLTPADDALLLRLGEIEEENNNIQAAVDYYQKAVLLNDATPSRFVKIADLMQRIGQYETALEAAFQAVELEPQNPKYLDNFIELAIICENKTQAEKGYQKLRLVNPDNKKLEVFREKISKLKGKREKKVSPVKEETESE